MTRPLIVAVVGGSGSGKTTVARALLAGVPAPGALVDQDSYYHDLGHLSLDERREVNFDHPDALDNALLAGHLEALARGEAIEKPTYDFALHTRATAVERIEPAPLVVVDGILLLADAGLRNRFDLTVFVDVADDIRFIRRLERDVAERGRTLDDVIRQYLGSVRPMHLAFVEPSRQHADVVIPEGGHNRPAVESLVDRVTQELERRRTGAA